MSESENEPDQNISTEPEPLSPEIPGSDFNNHRKHRKFATELLRLSLAAIAVITFLMLNQLFARDSRIDWLVSHTSLSLWLILSLLCFGVSTGLALCYLCLETDNKIYFLGDTPDISNPTLLKTHTNMLFWSGTLLFAGVLMFIFSFITVIANN